MLTIEGLQEIFEAEQAPYWRLYEGRTTRGPKRGDNLTVSDLSESFALLLRRLEIYQTGIFTICLSETNKFQNSRASQHTIQIGDASVAVSGNSQTQQLGAFAQLTAALDIAERVNGQSSESIGAIVASGIEDFKKDMLIAELRKELREARKGTARDRFIDGLVSRSPQLLDRLFGPTSKAPVVGNVGFEETEEVFDIYGDEDTGEATAIDQPAQDDSPVFSFDDALRALNTIQAALPGHNVNELLWKVANFIKDDPSKAVGLLSQL